MEPKEVWNSLEIVKLLVSALTPIIVVVLGIWIARITKRFEQIQWAGRRIIERRIDVYDEIAPMLNDLVVYFTFVGHWKELFSPQVVELSKLLDRRVHVSASLFSDRFLPCYFSFMQLFFKTYQGWGTDSRPRTDPKRHKETAGAFCNSIWDDMFCSESDLVSPQQVRYAYQELMKSLGEELQIGLQSWSVTSGRVPGGAVRSDTHPGAEAVTIHPGATRKPVQPFVFNRVLPEELGTADSDDRNDHAATQRIRLWQNGSDLHIRFLDGSAEQQETVRKFSLEWIKYANITFDFRDDPYAEIRISFDSNNGSWSYVGKDCLQILYDAPTMNLASVDKWTVLHLFGLALGLMAENQNPAGGFQLNEDSILRDLSICPDYSHPDTVRWFASKNLYVDQVNGAQFDSDSVMVIPIPDDWTVDMTGRAANKELSLMTKRSLETYMGRENSSNAYIMSL